MAEKKTIREKLQWSIRNAGNDLVLIDQLRDQHGALGLSPDRLDSMYEQIADYRAMLDGVLAMLEAKPDPRSDDSWRRSAEGRALERLHASFAK